MKHFMALIILSFAASLSAQSFYHAGVKTESFSTATAAWTFVQNQLDSRQQADATIVPMRIIDGPLSLNPPDNITYLVVWQPSSNNDTSAMVDASVSSQPAQFWFDGFCGGSVSGDYVIDNYASSSDALTAFGALMSEPHRAMFSGYVSLPNLGTSRRNAVIRSTGHSVFCQ